MEKKKKEKKYIETVKDTILDALSNGTSVLQKDRVGGIDCSINADTNTIYSGINQLFLQQIRQNKGFKSNKFLTESAIQDNRMGYTYGAELFPVTYWQKELKYRENVYPIGPNGKYDYKQPPIHLKGSPRIDANGNLIGSGYDQFIVVNLDQVDQRKHTYKIDAEKFGKNQDGSAKGGYIKEEQPKRYDLDFIPKTPEKCVAGDYYKAQNSSDTVDYFKQEVSKYINSVLTGTSFKASEFSKKQISDLKTKHFKDDSLFFKVINSASILAFGDKERNTTIENNRAKRAKEKGRGM